MQPTNRDEQLGALIVGAGPTGLTLAVQLLALGVPLRIVDRQLDRVRESRALAVQPRTLELLRTLGITRELIERGNDAAMLQMHAGGRVVSVRLFEVALEDTAYPFLLFVSQAETEAVLNDHLAADGNRRYVCGNVCHATGVCDAAPFDAALTDAMVLAHLDGAFQDFEEWVESVAAARASARGDLTSQVEAAEAAVDRLVRMRSAASRKLDETLAAGDDDRADTYADRLTSLRTEIEQAERTRGDLEARLAEWDADLPDDARQWWREFSDAIGSGIVNADTTREANRALRDRFAAIHATSPPDGTVRLDFVVQDGDDPVAGSGRKVTPIGRRRS